MAIRIMLMNDNIEDFEINRGYFGNDWPNFLFFFGVFPIVWFFCL